MDPCRRCGSELEVGDLRCPICALATSPASEQVATTPETAQVLRCRGCGAAVSYNIEVQAPACAFCRSVVELQKQADPLEEAEYFPAFEVDLAAARVAIERWWRVPRFFCPGNLSSSAMVEDLRPLRWVAWFFDIDARVSFSADSDAGARRSAWAPHAGQFDESYKGVLVSASRGLTQQETTQLGPFYSREKLGSRTTDPQTHDDHLGKPVTVERFDVQRSGARQRIHGALLAVAQESARSHVPGSSVRNLHVEVVPRRLKTRTVAFPVYVAAYRYQGKLFRAIVHGENSSCVVGKTPISGWKVALVVAVGLLLVLAALGLGIHLS